MEVILAKIGAVLLYLFMVALLSLTILGLAGNWFIVAIALVIKFAGWGTMTWWWFGLVAALAVLGEVVESLLGLVVVIKKGGTRWGAIGSFVGGLLGVFLGAGLTPPIGSVLCGFLGAFVGAALGEYIRNERLEEALRVGFWSIVGRTLATMGKVAVGVGMIWIIVVQTW